MFVLVVHFVNGQILRLADAVEVIMAGTGNCDRVTLNTGKVVSINFDNVLFYERIDIE